MNNGVKKPWLSKTLIVNALLALAAVSGFPGVSEYVTTHVELVMGIFAGLNFILRLVTKDAISIGD